MTTLTFRPGTGVLLHGEQKAVILDIKLSGPELAVTYRVAWFLVNQHRKEAWVGPDELDKIPENMISGTLTIISAS